MARSRTGSVEPFIDAGGQFYYRARIRLADGGRVRIDIPDDVSTPEDRADWALARQDREDRDHMLFRVVKAERAGKSNQPSKELREQVRSLARKCGGVDALLDIIARTFDMSAPQ